MIGGEQNYSFATAIGWPWDLSEAEPTMPRCPVMNRFFIASKTNRRWPPRPRLAGRRSFPDRPEC